MAFDVRSSSGEGCESLDFGNSLPIIKILQSLSPELKKNKPEYVEGAEEGDLFFTPTKETLPQPLEFVPVCAKTIYVEWKPLSQGGGLVGYHEASIISDPRYKQGVKTKMDEWLGDNELKKTTYWAIKIKNAVGEWENAVIPMSVTQLKVSRELSRSIDRFRYHGEASDIKPPIFARTFFLETVAEQNAAKQEYYNFRVRPGKVLDFAEDEALLTDCQMTRQEVIKQLPSSETKALPVAAEPVEEGDSIF